MKIAFIDKLEILSLFLYGEILKMYYKYWAQKKYCNLNCEARDEKLIVSLTSYGRRVSKILPYTIISLLRQTYKPDMIVLWLDSDNWNDDNLPKKLVKLKQYGLTIKYCKDLKSYKKLIPALEMFPNDIIVTCDDDIFYKKDMLERLMKEYEKDPTRIYTHRAHRLKFSEKVELLPYNDWENQISGVAGNLVFPTGVAGCLYKRSLLYKDICREDLFMKLAPKADDVWFFFMEVLQRTPRYVLPYRGYIYIPLDGFYQYFHKDASLAASNCKESQNDIQIRNVMEYYSIVSVDLMNSETSNI